MHLSFLFSRRDNLAGRWIDARTAQHGAIGGFVLSHDGNAKSINAASPQYTAWRRSGHTLTLWGNAHRAGQTMQFIESLCIHELTDDKLILSRADETFEYRRDG